MERRAFRRDVALAVVAIVATTAWLGSGWGGDRVTTAVSDLGAVLGAAVAGVACWQAARRNPHERTAWGALALACLLWGLGEAKWSWDEVFVQHQVPFPSLADAAYLAAVPAALGGLLRFNRATRTRATRTVLDSALVAGSLLFVLWALILGPIWNGGGESALAQIVNVTYPVTDLALLTVALLTVRWGKVRHALPLSLVAAGLFVMALTDLAFTYLTNNDTFSSTEVVSAGWIAAYLLLALAARAPHADASTDSADDLIEPVASLVLPYGALALAMAVATPRLLDHRGLDGVLSSIATVLVVVLLVRQAISLRENRVLVRQLHDVVRSLNQREAQLAHLALHDSLTGLANRSKLTERIDEILTAHASPPALLYVDFDGFKAINDRSGHETGDLVLKEAARRLADCVGEGGMVARLGGDEFVVLVRGGHDEAVDSARQILDRFADGFFVHGEVESLSASIGVAIAPADGSAEDAIRLADAAMYVAKGAGKARAVLYPDIALLTGMGAG